MERVRYHPCPVRASLPRRDAVVGEIEGLHTRFCRGPDCRRRFRPRNARHVHCSDRCRERAEKATEGPWKMGGEPEAWTPVAPDGTELVTCCCCGGFRGRRDVRFTVEARTDLPAALSVLDRIGEALAQFTESHLDRHLYVPLDKHGESEAANLLALVRSLRLQDVCREDSDGG